MTSNKLLEHFKRMQLEAADYLSSSDTHENNVAFINSILEALDGPEQREAENVGNTYIADALRTESTLMPLSDEYGEESVLESRVLHAAMGMVTEAAEFMDALKKNLFYGKEVDTTNLKEEIGDLMWYLAIACDALGTDFETEQSRNIAKLKARYPEKFSSDRAIERDLTVERNVLEGHAIDGYMDHLTG